MVAKSITFKLLSCMLGAFAVIALSVLLLADFQVKDIINRSQNDIYREKLEAIIRFLEMRVEKLKATGMRAVYEEDFQDLALRTLRQTYYESPNQRIFPFILNMDGEVLMHPRLGHNDGTLRDLPYIQRMVRQKEGAFRYTDEAGEKRWGIFRRFGEWNWIVGFTVPVEIKYADARLLRNSLAVIMAVIMLIVIPVMSAILAGIISPVKRLTEASKAMASGNLDQPLHARGEDEVGILAANFIKMRNSIKEKIAALDDKNNELTREIAERKEAEAELRKYRTQLEDLVRERTRELEKANEQLKEIDTLKSMFIASMSHELRTPLNSIIGFTGVILQGLAGEITEEQRDQLQRVYASAKHLLDLITDVIDVSKIEAGKVDTYVEEIAVEKAIADAVNSLKVQIDGKGLGLETRIQPGLRVKTDRRRLTQCIINYLSNAVKYSEKGGITITAGETDGMVEIRVKDSGIGISEEDLPRLFNSFVRIESHLSTLSPGTGLGLYLTKKLATEILGGSVAVESSLGKGSTFILRIPREIPS